jgi:hypothetical protein
MDTSGDQNHLKVNMGTVFYQCRAARVASFASNTINIVPGIELGTKTERPFNAIGSMDRRGDKEVGETFHGARINKGVNTVNQGVSLSFDPTTLRCIACTKEHNIISAQQKPVVICLSDQNFVSKFCGDTESCIVVARMENASLDELCDFLFEILDGAKLPHGSIILLGSVTHLHRFGTGIFARDWVRCVHRLESRFGGSQICPLTPVIRECFLTDLLRQMLELAAWMATVYSGTSRGLGETWPYLVNWLSATSADDHLDQPGSHISYIVPLPETLVKDAPVIPQRFQTTSSRSATVPGMCQRATDELLRVLLEALNRNLLAGVNPSILLREPTEELHSKDDDRTLVAIGASNLKRCVKHFEEVGYRVVDMTIPGWVISAANVESLLDTIKGIDIPPSAKIIFDLFGNSFCRWSQEDGTEALAVKTGSGYHLPGRVSVCSEEVFRKLIENTLPLLFELQRNYKIILPPLPRYLFRGCCPEYGHASNVSEEGYQVEMLEGLARLRAILKKQIVNIGLDKAWVGEGVGDLVPPSVKDKDDIIVCLRESCAADGVLFTDEGYATLSSNIHRSLESRFVKCCESMSAAASVSGRGGRPGNFYWRGFMSPVGSTRPKNTATSYKHVRNNRLPPYARAQPERKNRGGHQRSARGRGRGRY